MSDPGAPRNWTKAEVRREERDGRPVIVKDYSSRCWIVRRLFGRPSLHREAAVYQRLAHTPGVPACRGFEGPDALVLELAPGRPLSVIPPRSLPAAVFDALDEVLAGIHSRGVAIADLHRSNVLVDDAGAVHVVDFALGRVAASPSAPGFLVLQLQKLDRHAAARLRAAHLGLPEPRPAGMFGVLYRLGRALKPR